jgi:hypothetical protein
MWRREVKTVATVLMIGSWAGDGGLAKDKFLPESYCHM